MIFVTVGTDPHNFTRLLEKMDEIAEKIDEKIIAQIGESEYEPKNYKYFNYKPREEFLDYLKKARLIVSHGGAGVLLNCIKLGKPTVIVPRRKGYKEHVNDHQLDITRKFERSGKIVPCYDIKNLEEKIKEARELEIKPSPQKELKIKDFLFNYLESLK